ncbi:MULTISPECIES: EH signature domain-containing protein [unclassified Anabaena]|uniref:EH signature domain-containing protein n=1 Tax=unclassified Anabaena TaxID=2619674 RepID=UPI0039C65528
MNLQFSFPSLPETPPCIPNQLIQLASNLANETISMPNVDLVLAAIEQGKSDKISHLDWVYCIHAKAQWDQQNIGRCRKTSAEIWKVAISSSWLQHQLLWRLALYHSGQKEQVLAHSLAESFDVFANPKLINNLLSVQIILALRNQQPSRQLAKISCNHSVNQTELLNLIRKDLPIWIPLFSNFVEEISPYFTTINSPSQQEIRWLLSCLDEMSDTQQIKAVDYLLTNVSKTITSNCYLVVDWLRNKYRQGGNWYKLSDPARQRLREWIGGINYGDFQKLVILILSRLPLQNFESNRLRSRSKFWANYSNRFERLRILLPKTSQLAISYQIQGDVDLLEDDGSDSTEICIFDFGEWFVVEFFRGKGSEIRLFPNNPKNQQILFGESTLSVKQIRFLGGEKHDHVYLWQVFSHTWLANHRILPNANTQSSGNLTVSQLQDRAKKLELWRREIEYLERDARLYMNKQH